MLAFVIYWYATHLRDAGKTDVLTVRNEEKYKTYREVSSSIITPILQSSNIICPSCLIFFVIATYTADILSFYLTIYAKMYT
jgi:hypothetical protein